MRKILNVFGVIVLIIAFGAFKVQEQQPGINNGIAQRDTVKVKVNAVTVTGNDDVVRLKHLASGVGWEFSPNYKTNEQLKRLGIKTIRCINIEPVAGRFMPDGSFLVDGADRLLMHFNTCRAIGAIPHIIIGLSLFPELHVKESDLPRQQAAGLAAELKKNEFGPTDWVKFRSYYKAFFKYVLIDKGFAKARFEVGNEPDIGGGYTFKPPKPAMGTAIAYDAYLNMYRNIAQAANEFEKENPGLKVYLGGPALAWAFTFKFGDFNWCERFIKDAGRQKLKCDFIGLHYYGNISSQTGEFTGSIYPPFTTMLKAVKTAMLKYLPGKPIWITEWGPSGHTDNSAEAHINADQMGAAWSAAFLNTMLNNDISGALFLSTTDYYQAPDGSPENIWGWPALFVNPERFDGNVYPKPVYHVFDMISRLSGKRVPTVCTTRTLGAFSAVDTKNKTIKMILWNYNQVIPENGTPTDRSETRVVNIVINNLPPAIALKRVGIRRWQVSQNEGNAATLFANGVKLNYQNTVLPLVEQTQLISSGGKISYSFLIPASGVSYIEFSANGSNISPR